MHRTRNDLESELDNILDAPRDQGPVEMIVARPAEGERTVMNAATLSEEDGLAGDNWLARGSSSTPDGSANPQCQLTLMSSRAAEAVAGTRERWPLAGDQIFVDMDLSVANLPPGTRLSLGQAIIEISENPHSGCAKFSERFGAAALRFVNVGTGKALRLRGVNAMVVQSGAVQVGDKLTKLDGAG